MIHKSEKKRIVLEIVIIHWFLNIDLLLFWHIEYPSSGYRKFASRMPLEKYILVTLFQAKLP